MEESQNTPTDHFISTPEESSIIEIVDDIIQDAITHRASDIHLEPYEDKYRLRYRIDGVLNEFASPPQSLHPRISSRIKVMAEMDISERRLPQDGHFAFQYSASKRIDCRISSCPTINGEKIVIRLLQLEHHLLNTNGLGLSEKQHQQLITAITKPHGLILVTGPTGSGKTMTLYALLNDLNTTAHNIVSVEDPVEIKISGVNQLNINVKAGLTFASALRAFLRQDPDILMIGEIRDPETAELAIHAAQTGHLVISTLHANSAAETISRLNHLGIPSHDIASAISLIVAQRLVRKRCLNCLNGCQACHAGYSGRIGLFEVMPMSVELAQLIQNQVAPHELLAQAISEGMSTLFQSGLDKINEGVTALSEVERVAIST